MSSISSPKQDQFIELFQEFDESYPQTEDGQRHIVNYAAGREIGRRNYEEIIDAAERGEDVTDAVLLKLLPYSDTASNQARGVWIHLAPTIDGDIRKKYEGAGWTRPEEWPQIAQAILTLVRRCTENPAQIDAAACQEFDQLPYKGFQAGILSPILNAVRPDAFLVINGKSRDAINYFSDSAIGQALREYPEANRIGRQTVAALANQLVLDAAPDLSPADTFDMFSHWLRAVKKFEYRSKRKRGRVTEDQADKPEKSTFQVKVPTYDQLMNPTIQALKALGGAATSEEIYSKVTERMNFTPEQLKVIHNPDQGNQTEIEYRLAWSRTYLKKYGMIENQNRGTWALTAKGWQAEQVDVDEVKRFVLTEYKEKSSQEIEAEIFKEAGDDLTLNFVETDEDSQILARPFDTIFGDWETAEWTLDFLHHSLKFLGATGPEDERFALTLPTNHYPHVLRLNYGRWVVMDCRGPGAYEGQGFSLALLKDTTDLHARYESWGNFRQADDKRPIAVVQLPISLLLKEDNEVIQAWIESAQYIGNLFNDWIRSPYRRAHQQQIFTKRLQRFGVGRRRSRSNS